MEIKTDCRHYVGEKPCGFARLCDGCGHYEPWNERILIIKTAAMGDVLRTTAILPALRKSRPGAKITWIARAESLPLLVNNPYIDELLTMEDAVAPAILPRRFDSVYSLDKTVAECGLAMMTACDTKKGIGLSESGAPFPLDADAEYYFSLGLSDDLKFEKNQKTYQDMIREVCALEPGRDRPVLNLTEAEKKIGKKFAAETVGGPAKKLIGIIPAAGATFANKAPSAAKWEEIIEAINKKCGPETTLLLMGGPADGRKVESLSEISHDLPYVITEDVRMFAAYVGELDVILCGDTLALHIATALEREVVALFGPTCSQEIDLYDTGCKIITPLDCSPCYRSRCDISPNCMDALDPSDIASAVSRLIEN